MKNLYDELAKKILTKPDVIQFAKDRKYEESWIIKLSELRPSDVQIDRYIKKEKFEIIIVEYIWNSKDDDQRFVLTLFLDKNCKLQDPKKFIEIALNIFYNYQDIASFIKQIDETIIGNKYLMTNSVDSVNLSVFNHWLSVGPIELWKKGEDYRFDNIVKKIKNRAEIERTSLNYQGLLFRFNSDGHQNGPYYGLKTPCCSKVGKEWVINYNKVDYWMKLLISL